MRDTLKVMEDFSSGEAPVSSTSDYHHTFNGPKLPKHDRLPNTQPPSHLEVSMCTQQLLLKYMAKDHQEKNYLAAKHDVFTTKIVHTITAENKKRLWKLLQKFFSKKQLNNSHLQELYEYIDHGFIDEDFFMIASLHLCQLVSLQRIYFEFSCANCLMNQTQLHRLSNLLLSCKCNEVDPNAPSPSKTQVKLEGSAVAVVTEDEGVPHTSESKTSSDSSSGDAIIFILGQNNEILLCSMNLKVRLLPLLLPL